MSIELLQYIGHGHYRVSDKTAGEIARRRGRSLPRLGYMMDVDFSGGERGSLLRSHVSSISASMYGFRAPKRGWVWAVMSTEDLSRYQRDDLRPPPPPKERREINFDAYKSSSRYAAKNGRVASKPRKTTKKASASKVPSVWVEKGGEKAVSDWHHGARGTVFVSDLPSSLRSTSSWMLKGLTAAERGKALRGMASGYAEAWKFLGGKVVGKAIARKKAM